MSSSTNCSITGEGWIDVTIPLKDGMVKWPSDPPFHSSQVQSIEKGHLENVSLITMGTHTGTHMDAPLHYVERGKSMDAVPFTAIVGKARVVPVRDPSMITVAELEGQGIRRGERILLKTRNSLRCYDTDMFIRDFVYLSREAAAWLAAKKVTAVGIDYLSVGGFHADNAETHLALLEAGVWVIEGLNLSKIQPGDYDMICLPLKILNADGAPARVILRPQPGK